MIAELLHRGRQALAVGALLLAAQVQAASFELINIDPDGAGFNDPTPVAPVGGNPGTTLGQQRQIVFGFVADFWGQRLRSDVPIKVLATFGALPCTATGGTLGAAGAYNIFRDFPNAVRTQTWYHSALANKLTGAALIDNPDPFESADIITFFNGDIGKPGCLDGVSFYLGLDGKAGANQIDLVTTVLHEFGHGLGFSTFTSGRTGLQLGASAANPAAGFPSAWDFQLRDPQQRKTWAEMTPEERIRSAIAPRNLVWTGPRVTIGAQQVLQRGVPDLYVAGRGQNRFYTIGPAQFGPPLTNGALVSAELARLVSPPTAPGPACTPLDAADAAAVKGRVAIIDRGGCAFVTKVKNAQDAGARAVLIADNLPGGPPPDLIGTDPTITIPSARVSLEDGVALKAAVPDRSGKRPVLGPFAVLFDNQLRLQGADLAQRVFLYTPNPFRQGSSVSHFDTSATPNLLMEPFAEPNQPIAVSVPLDLTLELLRDIGW